MKMTKEERMKKAKQEIPKGWFLLPDDSSIVSHGDKYLYDKHGSSWWPKIKKKTIGKVVGASRVVIRKNRDIKIVIKHHNGRCGKCKLSYMSGNTYDCIINCADEDDPIWCPGPGTYNLVKEEPDDSISVPEGWFRVTEGKIELGDHYADSDGTLFPYQHYVGYNIDPDDGVYRRESVHENT